MKLIVDRSGWKRVRLDDVVEKREENDRENARTRFDNFVKGENLDPESLHLRRMGSQQNEELPPSFYKIFRKGQILFMTRRPYLRKNALAHCDGICGEKMLTLQVKEDVADARLIPFLFHSDGFYAHTTGCMIGSTNPHCRWRDVAKFEFLLPPKDQQAKLAELLWAADSLLEAQRTQINEIKTVTASTLKEEFEGNTGAVRKLGDVGEWKSGGTPSRSNTDFWGGDIPWVSPKDMKVERIADSQEKITNAAVESRISTLPVNTILIVVRGLILNHSFPVGITTKEVAFNQDMKALIASEEFDPFYILYFLQHMKDAVLGMTTTTTHGTKRLASDAIFGLRIPCPSIGEQNAFTAKIETIKTAVNQAIECHSSSKMLLKSLINQIF